MSKPFDPAELSARVRIERRLLALETRDLTIFAMAKLAESRDPESGAHLERGRSRRPFPPNRSSPRKSTKLSSG